jgi:hypothetical protein
MIEKSENPWDKKVEGKSIIDEDLYGEIQEIANRNKTTINDVYHRIFKGGLLLIYADERGEKVVLHDTDGVPTEIDIWGD